MADHPSLSNSNHPALTADDIVNLINKVTKSTVPPLTPNVIGGKPLTEDSYVMRKLDEAAGMKPMSHKGRVKGGQPVPSPVPAPTPVPVVGPKNLTSLAKMHDNW
jgi:hypothetical protein